MHCNLPCSMQRKTQATEHLVQFWLDLGSTIGRTAARDGQRRGINFWSICLVGMWPLRAGGDVWLGVDRLADHADLLLWGALRAQVVGARGRFSGVRDACMSSLMHLYLHCLCGVLGRSIHDMTSRCTERVALSLGAFVCRRACKQLVPSKCTAEARV